MNAGVTVPWTEPVEPSREQRPRVTHGAVAKVYNEKYGYFGYRIRTHELFRGSLSYRRAKSTITKDGLTPA